MACFSFWFHLFSQSWNKIRNWRAHYFMRPAAVSARVMTALTSIAGRCDGRPGLTRLPAASGRSTALMSGECCGTGPKGDTEIAVDAVAGATGLDASLG